MVFEDKIRSFFSGDVNCQLLRKRYMEYKSDTKRQDKPVNKVEPERYPDIDYTPQASKMDNFIQLDDVSSLNENYKE